MLMAMEKGTTIKALSALPPDACAYQYCGSRLPTRTLKCIKTTDALRVSAGANASLRQGYPKREYSGQMLIFVQLY